MFYFLSKLLDVFLSPLTWGLVLVALAIPWRADRRRRRWRRRRLAGLAALAVLLFFSIEPVSNTLQYRLEHAAPSTYRPDVTYDVVILLGGVSDERVILESGQPAYNESVERVIATHDLLAHDRARFAIVSGASVDTRLAEVGEARVLARQLAAWGIDPSRVLLEEAARNTRENAVYSARIVAERGFERVLLVTSAFHMARSIECFRAVGLTVDTLAVDFRAHRESESLLPRSGLLNVSTQVLREVAGLWVYRFQGYARR